MLRRPRLYIPGVPAHIVQRGNNREPCFFKEKIEFTLGREVGYDARGRSRVTSG
jgi:REP-associated tyrosine transposase